MGWTALVPVKDPRHAKSRLGSPSQRARLALAFAKDTVASLLSTPDIDRLLIVTNAPDLDRHITGAEVLREPSGAGLNGAVEFALATAVARDEHVIVAASDLPSLRAEDVTEILGLAAMVFGGRSVSSGPSRSAYVLRSAYVPDSAGHGTTMLLGSTPVGLRPQFGTDSSARHRAAGMLDLTGDAMGESVARRGALERAGRDVDTDLDLSEAVALGVGPHTALALPGLITPTRH